MKKYSAIKHLLVYVPEKYESRIITRSGFEFYKDTIFAGVSDTVRSGLIVSVPDGHDYLQDEDIVFFHHNITHEPFNYDGQRERSSFVIDGTEGIYYIPMGQEMIYAIERNGVFSALDGYGFVRDVYNKSEFGSIKAEHIGEMVYPSGSLTCLGIKKGDYVVLSNYAEYPFKIYNEQLYRVREKYIFGKWTR